ncbi:hypothetical protein L873DRAFT_200384 [Choiromyces venosus 120613-1]|uniref:Uncharacterized protein n=1 Tax=Choiromyces venosus 120613-1 TaxID=1336337 RepID=A0A3N4J1U6_9PEZI|nr:hypothetical protein L873DRAFT_200384 [Choiromyces venosus 120613-1]
MFRLIRRQAFKLASNMNTVKTLLRTNTGQLTALGSIFTPVGSGADIWDNYVGRNHAANNLDTDGVNTKIDGVKVDISRVEKTRKLSVDNRGKRMTLCMHLMETKSR